MRLGSFTGDRVRNIFRPPRIFPEVSMSGLRRFTVELDLKATAHNEMVSAPMVSQIHSIIFQLPIALHL